MYQTIPIQYLDYFLDDGFNGRIIDVRSRDEYNKSHIRGAENIELDELLARPELLSEKRPILFYCSRGSESLLASIRFSRMGYQVTNVANGLNLYRGKYLETKH